MNNINIVSALVKSILEDKPECRNSDETLYSTILEAIDDETGQDVLNMPVGYFLRNMNLYGCPKFETVRRARQRVQADNPQLRACESVEAVRMQNEAEIRAWARGKQS